MVCLSYCLRQMGSVAVVLGQLLGNGALCAVSKVNATLVFQASVTFPVDC